MLQNHRTGLNPWSRGHSCSEQSKGGNVEGKEGTAEPPGVCLPYTRHEHREAAAEAMGTDPEHVPCPRQVKLNARQGRQ